MVSLNKKMLVGIIGEVPLKDRPGGNVIGTAKIEKLKGGSLVAHVDARDIPEAITGGFSMGSFSLYKSDGEEIT